MTFAQQASAAADDCADYSTAHPSACIGIGWADHGYDAGVYVQNSPGQWDFNLWCDNGHWYGDEGSFYADSYSFHSYIFDVPNQGTCHVEAKDLTTLLNWESPDLTR